MKGKVLVRTRVGKETAAGCVSTGMCYRKNDNKDTNGSKRVNFCKILDTRPSSEPHLPFSSGGG